MVCDINMNEKVSKMEMFVLFKRIQGISIGMVTGQGMGMGMDMNVNMAGWWNDTPKMWCENVC